MVRALLAAACLGLGTLGGAGVSGAQAGDRLVVVELFTSQGCSSCPPADALLADLAQRDDVLPLALHVDYWDYIGWKDVFADPQFTRRQKAYARASGHRTIYTPQMIVQGRDHLVGLKPMRLADLIALHREAAGTVPVELQARRDGGMVDIRLRATGALPRDIRVQLVRIDPLERVEILRGENAGTVVDYANIVTAWVLIGEWDGQGEMRLRHELPGPDEAAVIVQQAGPGPILAAVRVD